MCALSSAALQVQKLALRSFLQRDWQLPGVLARVPLAFVTQVLLPSLAKEQHYPKAASGLMNVGTALPAGSSADSMDVAVRCDAWLMNQSRS